MSVVAQRCSCICHAVPGAVKHTVPCCYPPPVTADRTPERLSAEWIRPKPDPFGCYDCGLPYGQSGWCDAHVPNDVWAQISPTGHEGGVLCITCMARRCETLGLDNVPLIIGSGPWLYDPERARLDGLRQGREQALDSLAALRAERDEVVAALGLAKAFDISAQVWRDVATSGAGIGADLGRMEAFEECARRVRAALHPAPSEQPAQGGDDT